MCGISAGNNGFPLNEATRVALKTVRKWLERGENRAKVDKIVFVCYQKYEVKEYLFLFLFDKFCNLIFVGYEKWMQKYFPTSQLCLEEPRQELGQ